MNFDLNGEDFRESEIKLINDGKAGIVKDVEIKIHKKTAEDSVNAPDYKLIVTGPNGGSTSGGFYIPKMDSTKSPEDNKKAANWGISRVLSIAKAVMGTDYVFPEVNTPEEAFTKLFKLAEDNAGSKKFNVFVTYGTTSRPSKYLNLRFFDFIESQDTPSKLRIKIQDNMEMLVADENTPAEKEISTESWD